MGGSNSCAYPLKPNKPFEGILTSLGCAPIKGKDSSQSPVKITVSSTSVRCQGKPENLPGGNFDGEWSSNNEAGSWIIFDFTNKKVEIHGYSLKTYSGDAGGTHLKSWKLEAGDGYDWVTLDNVQNCPALNAKSAVLSKPLTPIGIHKLIRITQTGTNHFGSNCMTLSGIEFFGNVYP